MSQCQNLVTGEKVEILEEKIVKYKDLLEEVKEGSDWYPASMSSGMSMKETNGDGERCDES